MRHSGNIVASSLTPIGVVSAGNTTSAANDTIRAATGVKETVDVDAEILDAIGWALWVNTWDVEWTRDYTFGDLVYVCDRAKTVSPEKRIGYLEACWTYVYPWDGDEDDEHTLKDHAHEKVWQLRLLNGECQTWTNMFMIRLPKNMKEALECRK